MMTVDKEKVIAGLRHIENNNDDEYDGTNQVEEETICNYLTSKGLNKREAIARARDILKVKYIYMHYAFTIN